MIFPMYKAEKIQDSLALSLSVILFIAVSAMFMNIFIAEPPIEEKSSQTAKLKKILDKPTIKPKRNIQLPSPPPLKVKQPNKKQAPVKTIAPPPASIIQPKASKPFKPLVITSDTTTQEKLKLPPLKPLKVQQPNKLQAPVKTIVPPPASIIQHKASKPFKPLEITPDAATQEKPELPPIKTVKPKLENSKSNVLRASNQSIIKETRRKNSTHPDLISLDKNAPLANGRVLLRQLENGKGPEIQIAWPEQTRFKEKIYDILNKCYGMQTARMNSKDELFHSTGPSGVRWAINMDKMSGFIREVSGLIPQAEQIHVRLINRKHTNENFKSTIRIFPRVVDAHLLANLRSLAGEDYSTSKNISAAYGLKNNSILIKHVRVDGKELGRTFMLPRIKNQCS